MRTLADIVRGHAAERPDEVALVFGTSATTWRDLDERSSALAGALSTRVAPGDRIARLDKNGLDYFEILFAASKCNAVVVDLNWRLAPDELLQIVEDAEATLLFAGSDYAATVEQLAPRLTTVRSIVCTGAGSAYERYEDLFRDSPSPPAPSGGPDDVCLQLYTSGTTGLPKGVMLTNANLAACIAQFSTTAGLSPDSVCSIVMPLFHIGGAGWALSAMASGARGVVQREFDAIEALQAISDHGVTHAVFVPAMLQVMANPALVGRVDVRSLDLIFYGASPISDTVLRDAMDAFGCEFAQLYGLTETTGPVVRLGPEDHDPEKRPELLRSCGVPCPGVEIRVVDRDGCDVAEGTVGEVLVRSPQVMKGYWNQPEETARVLQPDGWFHSGDAGFVDDGYLYLQDRLKDIIISGAENISPAEVENALMAHPAVGDVAVIGVPDDRWGEAVKAIVVPVGDPPPTVEELIGFTRGRLAAYKCPKSVDLVSELPRNASGKLLKRELRERYWGSHDRRIN